MKTLTQLIGTNATNSSTLYPGSFTTLANNNSAQAVALGKTLVNDQHRYLIERYFDNERTYAIPTVGNKNLTFTAPLAAAAKTATMTTPWANLSCQQYVNFSSGDQRMSKFINGSAVITWDVGLSTSAETSARTIGVRDYPIPTNISKIKNVTVTIGQLVFQPVPVQSRVEWDRINVIPYTSDIPNYFFIWNNTIGIWPVPSTSNNVLSFNHKIRVPDLTFNDYSTGNITTMTPGSYAVVGTATNWISAGNYPANTDVSWLNLCLRVDPPYGDGIWYQIQSFTDDTHLTLSQPVINAPNITASSTYTIGQVPILQEDFHDTIVYGSLLTYYSSLVKDPARYQLYRDLYDRRLVLLEDYAGTKSVTVDLEAEPPSLNPNLFPYKPN